MFYKDLDLAKIRKEFDLDFAHYTFPKGMCSCCYGPKDMSKKYWKNNTIPEDNNYTYILFSNCENGSGVVHENDEIKSLQFILWSFPIEKMSDVCKALLLQLNRNYVILVPSKYTHVIILMENDKERIEKELKDDAYTLLRYEDAIMDTESRNELWASLNNLADCYTADMIAHSNGLVNSENNTTEIAREIRDAAISILEKYGAYYAPIEK